jgi:hypothetical protein
MLEDEASSQSAGWNPVHGDINPSFSTGLGGFVIVDESAALAASFPHERAQRVLEGGPLTHCVRPGRPFAEPGSRWGDSVWPFYWETSRKKPLLLDGAWLTWYCRLVRLSVGVSVVLDHEDRSELCCTTKFVEGMSQETTRLVLEDDMSNCGFGFAFRVKILPLVKATNFIPSAEAATEFQT